MTNQWFQCSCEAWSSGRPQHILFGELEKRQLWSTKQKTSTYRTQKRGERGCVGTHCGGKLLRTVSKGAGSAGDEDDVHLAQANAWVATLQVAMGNIAGLLQTESQTRRQHSEHGRNQNLCSRQTPVYSPGQVRVIPGLTASPTSTMSSPDRQELIRNAVAFLNDPKVVTLSGIRSGVL